MNTSYEIIGIVLVKNEDVFIEQSLTNILGFCDKIIVADNMSTDGTSEILRKLSDIHAKVEYHLIDRIGISHDLIKEYAGKKVWIFGVDGDEIYDSEGLIRFRKLLLSGIYDQWWLIFGNVLNCTELMSGNFKVSGYLAPPCRSMTKLYNFGVIESWNESSGERLHGGDVVFKSGFDKSLRLNLSERLSWEEADFRCLHMCFLQRSSEQKLNNGKIIPRPNPADIMSRNIFQRIFTKIINLLGIAEKGKDEWKIDKFTRGSLHQKDVSVFFPLSTDPIND